MSAAPHNTPAGSDAEKLEAAAVMFNEVANLAAELIRLMDVAIDNDEDVAAARALAAQVGFIADLGADGCGRWQVQGGAAAWLLSPIAVDAAARLQASGRMAAHHATKNATPLPAAP